MSVESDVRTYLLGPGQSASGCSTGYTFVGPMRPAKGNFPVEAVTIQEYYSPMSHKQIQDTNKTYRRNYVQIRLRGPIGSYAATKDRADTIWNAMNSCTAASLATSTTMYYTGVYPLQSGPAFFGENDLEQPEFVMNFRCENFINI